MIGKQLVKIETTINGDEGLKLTFEGGEILEFAYSYDEGTTWITDGPFALARELRGVDLEELEQ
jgi:hypothetical protein